MIETHRNISSVSEFFLFFSLTLPPVAVVCMEPVALGAFPTAGGLCSGEVVRREQCLSELTTKR